MTAQILHFQSISQLINQYTTFLQTQECTERCAFDLHNITLCIKLANSTTTLSLYVWTVQGASYNHFAGKDGARAFVTGCFQTHLTHDIRGFSDKEQKVRLRLDPFSLLHNSFESCQQGRREDKKIKQWSVLMNIFYVTLSGLRRLEIFFRKSRKVL